MHFSKIYIQKNFVPDIIADPFGREVIGTEVTLEKGESMDEAKEQARQYISEYIQKNTTYPDHNHIETRSIPQTIPYIQIDEEEPMSLDEQIRSCSEVKVLESYRLIIKNNPEMVRIYNEQMLKIS